MRFARSMAALRQLVQQTLLIDDTDIRSKLLQMGYNSPLLPQYSSQMETDNIGSMQIGEHKIYYRLTDGFVDANSICRINNKVLTNWLKTDSTWDLFTARARNLGIEFNCSKKNNSVTTRISAAFPSLIERKRGSSLNGGGSWIDNELATQLLIWVIPELTLFINRAKELEIEINWAKKPNWVNIGVIAAFISLIKRL